MPGSQGKGDPSHINSPSPDALRGKYQCFTQADQSKLRAAGYDAPFLSVQEGVDRYVRWLSGQL